MPDNIKVFRSVSCDKLDKLAREVLEMLPDMRVFALSGPPGAGKTTLVKAFCKSLGVHQVTSSPTFALVNEYTDKHGKPVYHFDCYRLRHEREAREIGMEEYLFSGAYCFVEWPEHIATLLPERYAGVRIQPEDEQHRTIEVELHG